MNPDTGKFHQDLLSSVFSEEQKDADKAVTKAALAAAASGILDPQDNPLLATIPEETRLVNETAEQKIRRAMAKEPVHAQALPPGWPRFQVGEIFHLKGHKFRVAEITLDAIIMRPVPKKRKG